jgi:hypothetical protein
MPTPMVSEFVDIPFNNQKNLSEYVGIPLGYHKKAI